MAPAEHRAEASFKFSQTESTIRVPEHLLPSRGSDGCTQKYAEHRFRLWQSNCRTILAGGLVKGFSEESGHMLYGSESHIGSDLLYRKICIRDQQPGSIELNFADRGMDRVPCCFDEARFQPRPRNCRFHYHIRHFDTFEGVFLDEFHRF